MVKDSLTQEMIDAGKELIKELDRTGLNVTTSLWLYLTDLNTYRLIVASPQVGKDGPLKVIKKIQTVLSKMAKKSTKYIPLEHISVVEDADSLSEGV